MSQTWSAVHASSRLFSGRKAGPEGAVEIEPSLKWDLIKMEMRGFTVQYSKRKAKMLRDKEKGKLATSTS